MLQGRGEWEESWKWEKISREYYEFTLECVRVLYEGLLGSNEGDQVFFGVLWAY